MTSSKFYAIVLTLLFFLAGCACMPGEPVSKKTDEDYESFSNKVMKLLIKNKHKRLKTLMTDPTNSQGRTDSFRSLTEKCSAIERWDKTPRLVRITTESGTPAREGTAHFKHVCEDVSTEHHGGNLFIKVEIDIEEDDDGELKFNGMRSSCNSEPLSHLCIDYRWPR